MRICQLIESTSGGSVKVALDLTQGLLAFHDDIAFVYSPLRADQRFFEASNKILGAQFVSLSIQSALCLGDVLSLVKFIWFLWKKGPFDVLHAHSSKAGGIARIAAIFFPRMGVVYSPHAFVTMAPDSSVVFRYLEKILSWRSDAILAVSQKEKEHAIKQLGINACKIFVVPNSVPEVTGCDNNLRSHPGTIVLGFVGRLVKQKNVERLIYAFNRSFRESKNLKLLIIGDGPERQKLEELLKELKLDEFVQCVGEKEASSYYSSMDALICSSNYEGFPLVFLEALGHGVPIISTPVGGVDEAVVEGQTGFVATDFSIESLSQAICRFLALENSDMEQITANCRAHASEFTRARMVATVREIYQVTVARKRD